MPILYVDADGAPKAVKEVVYKAARTRKIETVLVANSALHVPKSSFIRTVQVAQGLDVADTWIAQHCEPGDLVVTQDVPLAAEVIEKGVDCIGVRGDAWTASNIRQRLSMRDFFTELRASGVQTGGPRPFDNKAKQQFANALDRWLTKALRERG